MSEATKGREYAADWEALKAADPEVADAIAGELERERTQLRLIASENYASPAVLAAIGSTMNNKYAEGYPGRRYYGGCEFVDVTEQLAIDRAKQLFGADHANVQPHAGAQANMAVFGAFLEPRNPNDKVLGMVLAHGGHLTHGSPVNVTTSACWTGLGNAPPATSPMKCDASTQKSAPTSSAIWRNAAKSIVRAYAV